MNPLPTETRQGVVIVRLEQPGKPVIVLDEDLIRRLEITLKALPQNTRAMILASASDRVFVAGADLKSIGELDDDALHSYLAYGTKVFGMIPNLRFPSVAAINGAALGGGLELAMHCDGLVGAPPPEKDGQPGKPYPIGLPEAGLGLCPGWGGTNLLPARIDPAIAIERTATGQNMTYAEAAKAGLFDAIAPDASKLFDKAIEWVLSHGPVGHARRQDGPQRPPHRWIGRTDRKAAVLTAFDTIRGTLPDTDSGKAVALAVDAGLTKGWEAAIEVERQQLVRLRHTKVAKAKLAEFFARSAAPKK
jgi:enoyl-CoA hydratase/carnithine racemase